MCFWILKAEIFPRQGEGEFSFRGNWASVVLEIYLHTRPLSASICNITESDVTLTHSSPFSEWRISNWTCARGTITLNDNVNAHLPRVHSTDTQTCRQSHTQTCLWVCLCFVSGNVFSIRKFRIILLDTYWGVKLCMCVCASVIMRIRKCAQ